jgi:diacylglycerol kinase
MNKNSKMSIKCRMKSFLHAFNGLYSLWMLEPNFKIHIIVTIIATIGSYALEISKIEFLIVLILIAFVLITEALTQIQHWTLFERKYDKIVEIARRF